MGYNEKQNISVTVSDDKMEALLYLTTTKDEMGNSLNYEFTEEEILERLAEAGVKEGIDHGIIKSAVINHSYDRYICVAKGKQPENGHDGYYDFLFRIEIDNKPKILEDGSVDYHNIDIYEPVSPDELVAKYTPATSGHYGYTVTAQVLTCSPGKELQPLKGKGFRVSEDGHSYYSTINGKIELKNNELMITNVLDINGDVDITTGDIVFSGDVIIHGSVLTGAIVRTKGNLTIMGNVEGAAITVGGNAQLKSGMQGGGKGFIECDGDVWGKFFENTILRVKGELHANSLLNCDTQCEGNMFITGKHGIIVGGQTTCLGSIDATIIGNLAEVKTILTVGMNQQSLDEITNIKKHIAEDNEKQKKHEQIIEKLYAIGNPTDAEKLSEMKMQVEASLEQLKDSISQLTYELQAKQAQLSAASNSRVHVLKSLYPHVKIVFNGAFYDTKDTFTNVTIKEAGGSVQILNDPM